MMGYTYFEADIEALTNQFFDSFVSGLREKRLVVDRACAVVVLDRDATEANSEILFKVTSGEGDFVRLVENSIRKARSVRRTGFDSIELAGPHRHLLRPGDMPFGGGVVRGDLFVGASGLSPDQDHWVAGVVAGFINLKRQEALEKWRSAHPEASRLELQ